MNKLKSVFIISLLLSASVLVIVNNDVDVEASGGGGEGEGNNGHILDFDYIWEQALNMSNVIYKYPNNFIPRGRSFGSWGANYTVNEILKKQMETKIDLENVTGLPIRHIETEEYWKDWEYTSYIWVNDFNLTINNDNYPLPNSIPKKEHFLIPAGRNNQTKTMCGGVPTFNNSFENIKILPKNMTGYWPFSNFYNNYSYTINNYEDITNFGTVILGNLTFISEEGTIPPEEKQIERVFLLNESVYCQDQLDNITNASGCLIIDKGTDGVNLNTASCTYSVVTINEGNGTDILNILKNYSDILVDNITGNLTFTYNFSDTGCLPSSDYFVIDRIPDHHELANGTGFPKGLINFYRFMLDKDTNPPYDFGDYLGCWKLKTIRLWMINKINQGLNNLGMNLPICKGIILYSSFEHHWMFHAWYNFQNNEYNWSLGNIINNTLDMVLRIETPRVQTFTMNYTVGSFLVDNHSCTTLSGYGNQSLLKETPDKPAVEAYNVIGNITIDHNPNDAIAILSNRIDGWWGQTPGDSGIGGAIILGIAKYFKDYDIKPKYNLTFLFTTGEEIGCRGAWHYNHSHINDNIIFYLGMDQLGMAQNDQALQVFCSNPNHQNILNETVNQAEYYKRTGYENETENSDGVGSEMFVFSGRDNCDSFMFIKGALETWDHWHRTGLNYTEGDCLNRMDQNDVNVTAELAWNITKYFIVDPDCWYKNANITVTDSDDIGNLVDTVTISYDVKSILPHDLAMNHNYLTKMISPTNDIVVNETANFTINSSEISKSFSITLPSGESPGYYVFHNKIFNSTGRINEILDLYPNNHNQSTSTYSNFIFLYPYNCSINPPVITNVSGVPDPVGYGGNVTISTDVTSNYSSIDKVKVYIYKPSGAFSNHNMTNTVGDTYEYTFNNTWQHGKYNYTIWAEDANGNESSSPQHSFNVSAQATVSVCTVKDEYDNNTIVNITDPPAGSPEIGYELLDNGDVLCIWNRYDSYYFNTSSGIQLTNHYNEYWSHNVLMLGYYSNDEWNLIYRTDELSGFNKNITSGEDYVNATLWKDLNYEGYDFRLAIRYHLGADDNELTIIPYIKNIDDEDIPYNLGFAWEIKDIQISMTPENDYIEINGKTYLLNQNLDETYTNLDDSCFYIREDLTVDKSESLYLRWDEDLSYKVKVKSREGQYNAPVTLGIKIGMLNVGQEKHTSLFWYDASEIIYYFNSYDNNEAWATNPGYMVDGNASNPASTTINGDIESCNSNNCSGTDLGTISKVELRVSAYYTGDQRDTILRPSFPASGYGDNYHYQTPTGSGLGWSPWFDITNDPAAPGNWYWNDVKFMDCDVEAEYDIGGLPFTLYCSQVEIRVTYTQYTPPEISNPVPADGSTDISICPVLNITVSDPGGDNMSITWLSNSSGSWVAFGTNNSVGNGTYHQIMSNASVNGQWWYWKVNVSDGLCYNVSSVFKFYTGYESKIENTGSTNFSGYLLIQVQFYNETSENWVVANDTINETTPRTINTGEQFGLDTVFNGLVNTSNLSGFGSGTYRIYAAFRDPDGDVLVCDDETLMEDSYEFTVSDS